MIADILHMYEIFHMHPKLPYENDLLGKIDNSDPKEGGRDPKIIENNKIVNKTLNSKQIK